MGIEWFIECFDKSKLFRLTKISLFPDACRLPSQTRSYPIRSPELQ